MMMAEQPSSHNVGRKPPPPTTTKSAIEESPGSWRASAALSAPFKFDLTQPTVPTPPPLTPSSSRSSPVKPVTNQVEPGQSEEEDSDNDDNKDTATHSRLSDISEGASDTKHNSGSDEDDNASDGDSLRRTSAPPQQQAARDDSRVLPTDVHPLLGEGLRISARVDDDGCLLRLVVTQDGAPQPRLAAAAIPRANAVPGFHLFQSGLHRLVGCVAHTAIAAYRPL